VNIQVVKNESLAVKSNKLKEKYQIKLDKYEKDTIENTN